MTYDAFVAEWNGKYVDFDGFYGAQCVDLVQQYAKEIGMPRFYGNAADVANQYAWPHVTVPQRGDVAVFPRAPSNGGAGHIAIWDSPNIYYFSQNYPTGSNSHIQYIPEKPISYLRPTTLEGGNVADPSQTDINLVKQEREELRNLFNQSNYKIAEREYLYRGINASDAQKRKWINTHPVDDIISGIEKETGIKVSGPNEAQQKLNKVMEALK